MISAPPEAIIAVLENKDYSHGYCDILQLFTAKAENQALVTNDKKLRKACDKEVVNVIWEFELFRLLYKKGAVPKTAIKSLVTKIVKNNPFLSKELIERFNRSLE